VSIGRRSRFLSVPAEAALITSSTCIPGHSSSQLTTVGAWASGGSLIRVRVDQAVSYDAATGGSQWTLSIPGTDVACSVSGTSSSSTTAPIAYGQDSTTCDHVMAVDLAIGRQIWSDPVTDPCSGNSPTGALAGRHQPQRLRCRRHRRLPAGRRQAAVAGRHAR
jgi:hypothetical protein